MSTVNSLKKIGLYKEFIDISLKLHIVPLLGDNHCWFRI